MKIGKFYNIKGKIVAGALIVGTLLYPIQNTSAQTKTNPQATISYSNQNTSENNPSESRSLAGKSIDSLTIEEKRTLVEKLVSIESQGDSSAVNTVIRERKENGIIISADTIYSVGESQINVSSNGALADYNQFHDPDFTPQDMFNPAKNRIVRDWYLWTRIPQLFDNFKIERTVANLAAAYNLGAKKLKKRGGDAIRKFKSLPRITKNYVEFITGEEID